MIRLYYLIPIVAISLLGTISGIHAQSLEPRAYSNAPVGLNFVFAGFQNSTGALIFDTSLPLTDANADVNMGLIGYVRTLDVAGNLAKFGVILPYASQMADPKTRQVTEITRQHGFWHMGAFGADYKKLFAELPSETLKLQY